MGPSPARTLPPKSTVVGLPGECPPQRSLRNMHCKEPQNKDCHRFRQGACGPVVELSTSVTDVYITSQLGKVP